MRTQSSRLPSMSKDGRRAISTRSEEYIQHDITTVDMSICKPGAHARAIKPGVICLLMEGIREDGFKRVSYTLEECSWQLANVWTYRSRMLHCSQESLISVRQISDTEYAVIVGMHRVTSLQNLKAEGFEGPRYDKVASAHWTSLRATSSCKLCRYGVSATRPTHQMPSCWRSH